MIKRYIIVGPYEIDGITGVHNDIVAGLVSPTALAGLGHKIQLELKNALPSLNAAIVGTAGIVHSWSKMEGHPKFPPVKEATKGAPITDEVKLRAKMSFVFKLHCDLDAESFDFDVAEAEIISFLSVNMMKYGFAGGKVFPARASAASLSHLVGIVKFNELATYLGTLPAGNVLFDRRDLLSRDASLDADSLDRFLRILTRRKDPETGRYATVVKGFIVPINVGFQALEKPVARSNPRIPSEEQKHVYAESISSFGEYKSVRSIIKNTDGNQFDGCFWTHYSNPETGTYYVSASGEI